MPRTTTRPTDAIQIRVIKPEESDNVIQFLLEHFFPHGPLGSSEPKLIITEEDKADLRKCIAVYGCSIMALEGDQLVGVSIAMPKKPSSIDEYFMAAEKLGNTKGGQISKLLGEVNRDARIFERYGVEEFLYLFLSSVAPNHRGRNIAALMTQELMRLGKQWNYQVLTADCISFYCARVCERLGMECLNTVVYENYLDESGKPIFKPPPPHVAMKTYGQRLI